MRQCVANATTLIGMALIGGSLSGCSQKGDSDPLILEPRNVSGTNEDKFGKGFGTAFNADPNSEPRNVQESDVAPVSLTTEPVAID